MLGSASLLFLGLTLRVDTMDIRIAKIYEARGRFAFKMNIVASSNLAAG